MEQHLLILCEAPLPVLNLLHLLAGLPSSCQERSGLFPITLDLCPGPSFYFIKFSVFLVKLESEIFFFSIKSQLNFTVRSIEGVAPE